MKVRTTLLAIALGSLFSTAAFAEGDDATIYSDGDMLNSIYVIGDIYAYGEIRVASESGALVDQDQLTEGNVSYGDGDNSASASGDALSAASGNIGANIAAGVGNAQSNGMAASVNSSGTIAKASADSEQFTIFNELLANCDLDNTASLSGAALSSAVGNIGVNIAAGVGNAQHNGLSIAVASCGTCD